MKKLNTIQADFNQAFNKALKEKDFKILIIVQEDYKEYNYKDYICLEIHGLKFDFSLSRSRQFVTQHGDIRFLMTTETVEAINQVFDNYFKTI